MSCFKCGRELPVGQVECESGCRPAAAGAMPGPPLSFTNIPVVAFTVDIDPVKADADEQGFMRSVQTFRTMLGEILVNSGLARFVKRE